MTLFPRQFYENSHSKSNCHLKSEKRTIYHQVDLSKNRSLNILFNIYYKLMLYKSLTGINNGFLGLKSKTSDSCLSYLVFYKFCYFSKISQILEKLKI
jgi:hypothetical protein